MPARDIEGKFLPRRSSRAKDEDHSSVFSRSQSEEEEEEVLTKKTPTKVKRTSQAQPIRDQIATLIAIVEKLAIKVDSRPMGQAREGRSCRFDNSQWNN